MIPIYISRPTYTIRGVTLTAHKGGFKNSQMQEDNWMLMIKKQRLRDELSRQISMKPKMESTIIQVLIV